MTFPAWLEEANWLSAYTAEGKTFLTKLQLVWDQQHTPRHYDNTGCDTWMKVLVGIVLVATWSFDDAVKHSMADFSEPVDWDVLHAMPSARLFIVRQGDVLVMPAGTYHYVYTVKRKLVVAADFLNASGWRTRVDSVAYFGADRTHAIDLAPIFCRGVRIEGRRAAAALDRRGKLSAQRARYYRSVLDWHRALLDEADEGSNQVRRLVETPEVHQAVALIVRCLSECTPSPTP